VHRANLCACQQGQAAYHKRAYNISHVNGWLFVFIDRTNSHSPDDGPSPTARVNAPPLLPIILENIPFWWEISCLNVPASSPIVEPLLHANRMALQEQEGGWFPWVLPEAFTLGYFGRENQRWVSYLDRWKWVFPLFGSVALALYASARIKMREGNTGILSWIRKGEMTTKSTGGKLPWDILSWYGNTRLME
jgi:hypothetical protein